MTANGRASTKTSSANPERQRREPIAPAVPGAPRKLADIAALTAKAAREANRGATRGVKQGAKRGGGAPEIDLILANPGRITVSRKVPAAKPAPKGMPENAAPKPSPQEEGDGFQVLQWADLGEPAAPPPHDAEEAGGADAPPAIKPAARKARNSRDEQRRRAGGPRCFQTPLVRAQVAMARLHASQVQARKRFEESKLWALAASIEAAGLPQPIMVRPHPDLAGDYEVVAGEILFRAAQLAGLEELPVAVGDLSDRDVLECALLENLQRRDLPLLDAAEDYRRLIVGFGYSEDEVARAAGKERAVVAGTLRLLDLPPVVKEMLRRGELNAVEEQALAAHLSRAAGKTSTGAAAKVAEGSASGSGGKSASDAPAARPAKSLAAATSLPRPVTWHEDLTAQQAWAAAGRPLADEAVPPAGTTALGEELNALERRLRRVLGLEVQISTSGRRGCLALTFTSLVELERLVRHLSAFGEEAARERTRRDLAA